MKSQTCESSASRGPIDYVHGPGKMLPYLSEKFRAVYGYDFSDRLLDSARRRCADLKNVHIEQADLSLPVDHLPLVDVIVSLNAVLTPDPDLRLNFLVGMASRLDSSGHLLLNVPSVESLLFTYFRQIEWSRSRGQSPREAEMSIDTREISTPAMVAQGIFIRGAQPTKHYLRDELIVLARRDMGLSVLDVMKMEYDWRTEMEDDSVPDWMARAPGKSCSGKENRLPCLGAPAKPRSRSIPHRSGSHRDGVGSVRLTV